MSVLEIDNRNGALWVSFNRPEVLNSLSPESCCLLMDMWEQAEHDDSVRVVVLTGTGDRAFCTGADLKLSVPLLTGARQPQDDFDRRFLEAPDVLSRMILRNRNFCKPVVSAINGVAMGGGVELVLATDIRIASSSATFALPEPKVGMAPGGGAMVRLPRQIPWCQAMEFLLTGDTISADQAKELGIINRVVAPDSLLTEVERLVAKLIKNAPLALQAIKHTAIMTSGIDLNIAFAIEDQQTKKLLTTEDAREGPRAFAEKRQPVYRNR